MAGKSTMQIGDKFGMLTVVDLIPDRENPIALCRCECGETTRTQRGALRSGKAKSCGCLTRRLFSDRARNKQKMPIDEMRRRRNISTLRWQLENREKYRENMRAWYHKNKVKVRESSQKRKESKKQYDAEYRINNKIRMAPIRRLNDHRRRVRRRDSLGVVSKDIVSRLEILQKNRCTACRCDFMVSGDELDLLALTLELIGK